MCLHQTCMLMAIDEDRYDTYDAELRDYVESLSFEERRATIEAKLLDWLSRTDASESEPSRIQRRVSEILNDEISDWAAEIFDRHERTVDLVNDLYDDVGDDVGRTHQRIQAIEAVNIGELGDYQRGIETEIRGAIQDGLRAGEGVDGLRERISPISLKARAYADTIAKTHVKSYGRALKATKARLASVPAFEYVGIVRDTTRPFCRNLVGSTHHVDDIRRMRNGNREPVHLHCGGWNCIHDWEPDPFASVSSGQDIEPVDVGSTRLLLPV